MVRGAAPCMRQGSRAICDRAVVLQALEKTLEKALNSTHNRDHFPIWLWRSRLLGDPAEEAAGPFWWRQAR